MIAENPCSSFVETCLCPPGRSMAYDFQTKENGSRAEKTRPAQTRKEDAMIRWMGQRAWIGSRLTLTGKCQISFFRDKKFQLKEEQP